jgi:hypothetical protein
MSFGGAAPKRALVALIAGLGLSLATWAQSPVVGRLLEGPYPHAIALLDGAVQLSYARGADGGLFVSVRARTQGWVGVGLGAEVMSGATIFMGYLESGKPVFSEQIGKGHSHAATDATYDREEVYQADGFTTVEFHLPPDKLPFAGNSVPFIVAYSDAPDLATYHEDNHDSGVFLLQ